MIENNNKYYYYYNNYAFTNTILILFADFEKQGNSTGTDQVLLDPSSSTQFFVSRFNITGDKINWALTLTTGRVLKTEKYI